MSVSRPRPSVGVVAGVTPPAGTRAPVDGGPVLLVEGGVEVLGGPLAPVTPQTARRPGHRVWCRPVLDPSRPPSATDLLPVSPEEGRRFMVRQAEGVESESGPSSFGEDSDRSLCPGTTGDVPRVDLGGARAPVPERGCRGDPRPYYFYSERRHRATTRLGVPGATGSSSTLLGLRSACDRLGRRVGGPWVVPRRPEVPGRVFDVVRETLSSPDLPVLRV